MLGSGISFLGVSKSYGDSVALTDFSLTLEPGEFVTLLGPSGSGKTTALNILAGFVAPTGGDLQIGGQSVLHLPPEKRNLGMVFQSYSLFPHLSIFDNVAFPLRLRKTPKDEVTRRVNEALEMIQLADMGKRMPSQLSGGQRQRIAFARAVVSRPSVLLMDEPLGALDLKLREAMQKEIRLLHRQLGCTILFVTHDQGEALAMSDRVVVMNHARIAQVGTPQEIYDRPQTRHVAEFIGTSNLFALSVHSDGTWAAPDLGPLDTAPGDGRWPLTAKHLSVRPERLHRAAQRRSDVSFDAEVIDVAFLGESVEYMTRLKSGVEVHMRESRGRNLQILERGAVARLGFDLADATAF